MISKNKLVLYCPLYKPLAVEAVKNNFHKYVVHFSENPFFRKFGDKVLKYLKKRGRRVVVLEGLRYWYFFLMANNSYYVRDGDYYPRLTNFFIQNGVFKAEPKYFKPRSYSKYIVVCYKNNKFYFCEKFATINEIEIFFNLKIKMEKYKYTINYKKNGRNDSK